MTEPTSLPPESGSSQPAPHAAADLPRSEAPVASAPLASAPLASGCCGGVSHAAAHAEPAPASSLPVTEHASMCGSAETSSSVLASSSGLASSALPVVGHASVLEPVVHSTVHAPAVHSTVSHAAPLAGAELAAAPVATLTPPVASTENAPLQGHAGSLTPLTDATAQDIEAALKSAQKARASQAVAQAARPKGSDLIARKLVLRRDRWDSLLKLTNALRAQRGIIATPAEVAAIVLDAGLNVILEESAQAARPQQGETTEKARGRRAGKAQNTTAAVTASPVAAAPVVAPETATPAASVPATQIPAAPVAPAAAVKPRAFQAAELAHIRKTVRGLPSARSVQRTLGLWLGANALAGHSTVGVPIEDLRALCREFKVYDTANFAQNMKKDGAFFAEVRDARGERLGYDLTPKGREAAVSFHLTAVPAKASAGRKASRPAPRAAKRPAPQKRARASAKRRGR